MVIADFEPQVFVESRFVNCDGGVGSSGHPNVYLNIGVENQIVCPYCSRVFILNTDIPDRADR